MKLIFILIEISLSAAAMYFVLSQIVLPALFGTKLFPFFSKEQQLKEEILDINQEIYEQHLENQRDGLKAQLKPEAPEVPETPTTPPESKPESEVK